MKVVIIGGGLGGLMAGALLSKEGFKVLLLEQHSIVGGCATVFKRGSFNFEVSLHEIDGVFSNPILVEAFEYLDVYKNIEFIKIPNFFEVKFKDDTFLMPNNLEEVKYKLTKKFPEEKKGIERYFNIIDKIYVEFSRLLKSSKINWIFFPIKFTNITIFKGKTVSDVFDKLFKSEKLKIILNSNLGYYNDSVENLSFLLHAVAQNSYYKYGGYYIKGGSYSLSNYLATVIKSNGGKVFTRATVIKCEKDKVIFKIGRNIYSEYTDLFVSNLSPEDTYKLFNIDYRGRKELSLSLLTIYIGFKESLKKLYGKRAYSTFFLENVENYKNFFDEDIFKRSFVFVDYSQINSGLTSKDKSVGTITTVDYIDSWKNLNRKEYIDRKKEVSKKFIERLEKYYPNITNYIELVEVGTPKTIEKYIKTPKGVVYGYKPTPKQFFKEPEVKSKLVDNLYFVGQWVISGGFSPSIMSGILAFKKIKSEKIH
ncbi:MAG: hypothetical protein DSY59_05705 [Persephonella sp.]|nr:MAG: hypothetical protein DSY60_05095 [Persephonella sp.]RUM58488.1 MAG: hypothetical protein DSY59_05705 [Persephonella sp.]